MHIYFAQNVHYPEQVYKLASKLLSLSEIKYPKKLLLRMDLLYNKLYHSNSVKNTDGVKKFIVQKAYRDNSKSDYFLHQNTIKSLKS